MLRSRFCWGLSVYGRGNFQTFSLLNRRIATNLDRWQRCCDRLTQLQRKIRFPPLQTITVNGRTYQLPLSTTEPVRLPSQEELEYLTGFFDGDGCVTFNRKLWESRNEDWPGSGLCRDSSPLSLFARWRSLP